MPKGENNSYQISVELKHVPDVPDHVTLENVMLDWVDDAMEEAFTWKLSKTTQNVIGPTGGHQHAKK